MGIFSSIRKRRVKDQKNIKAAQSRARQEAKEGARGQQRREKLLAGLEKDLIKSEEKGLKQQRKHEEKLAKQEYEKIRAGRLNPDRVNRWIKAARLATPVLLPLAYRAITAGREQVVSSKARRSGLSTEQLAQFSGHGADLKARIEGVRGTLDDTKLSAGFRRDVNDRLDELHTAADNAEFMTPDQRRRALNAINRDIDTVAQDIQNKLLNK